MTDETGCDDVVYRLPPALRQRAIGLGADLPPEPVYIHVGALPPGITGAASDARVWIATEAFRPDTLPGLTLIGHELAHLAQQKSAGAAGGAAFALVDPAREAAADRFGAAFADPALCGVYWAAAVDPARPRGAVEFSGSGAPVSLEALALGGDFGDVEEDDWSWEDEEEEEEDNSGPQVPGAKKQAKTLVGTAKQVADTSRVLGGAGVSATSQVSSVLGGTAAFGHQVTPVLSSVATSAMAPAMTVLGPVGIALMILDLGLQAKSVAHTYSHICALERILDTYRGTPGVSVATLEAIAYTLVKKNKKLKRKGLGCVPVLGSICNTVYTTGHTIGKRWDGTRGTERRAMAKTLWLRMQAGDPAAVAACENLLGTKIFTRIRGCVDGDVVLKKKMKSL